jgi:hypothetical protein
MNILAQLLSIYQSIYLTSELRDLIDKLVSTVYMRPSIFNFSELIEKVGNHDHEHSLETIKFIIEEMDRNYRISEDRRNLYYVKQTRDRTILTLFGALTYRRTEYIDRSTKEPFCYVDWKLGLRKWERYDPCVQALIVEKYADSNSMIKVGKEVGDRMSGVFNTKNINYSAIPRQTVYNILRKHTNLNPKITRVKNTPKILYIMSDEKFVPIQDKQGKKNKKDKPEKQMVKEIVIFEDIEAIQLKNGAFSSRKQLINKTIVIHCEENPWETVLNVLSERYDMDEVELIYISGDGASWIKSGVAELKNAANTVKYGIDKFHFHRAIERISPDFKNILLDYCIHDSRKDFIELVDDIKESSPEKIETILQNENYILNNWQAYQTSIKEIIIGCPMEQAIAHDLASVFTSVGKAYSKNNLEIYLANREHLRNGCHLRNLVLQARAIQDIKYYSEFDLSLFEKTTYSTSPTVKEFNRNPLTKF